MLTPEHRESMRLNIESAQAKIATIATPPAGTTLRSAEKVTTLVLLDILACLISIDERLDVQTKGDPT